MLIEESTEIRARKLKMYIKFMDSQLVGIMKIIEIGDNNYPEQSSDVQKTMATIMKELDVLRDKLLENAKKMDTGRAPLNMLYP